MNRNLIRNCCFILIVVFCNLLVGCVLENEKEEIIYQHVSSDSILKPEMDYIMVIGDIQEYTRIADYQPFLNNSLEWIKKRNGITKNIRCVLQNGDVTNNNTEIQWKAAKQAFDILQDSIMYIWCTGNHDYTFVSGLEIQNRESSLINKYGTNPLLNKAIVARFEENRIDNIIAQISLKDRFINIISLEFGSNPEAVLWAQEYVSSHPNELFILMTHEYMTGKGERVANGTSYAKLQFPTLPYSEPEYIWEKLVWPNDNIICVLCGHNGFCKYLESTNKNGRKVPQILFNLQYQENGGDSMIQIWELNLDEREVCISVYNTMRQYLYIPSETSYSFTY